MRQRITRETFSGQDKNLPDPPGPVSTVLDPLQEFPSCLAELVTETLQVLHSRVCRQLDREYLEPLGPHPQTLERYQELISEFEIRETTAI
ncbi:hypothetical protein IUU84_08120 [Kocuria rhizophila]|uniref:hypothetical protein n=1 Tax=Kocuria rhizophila TaxID=72000 RepID=UPI00294A01A7|nr:hypothetical protein [Kocuria rhizophila]MDV5999537.1 hypothetical protein [Kocuria rhizophila]